jgi:hypothetical protein
VSAFGRMKKQSCWTGQPPTNRSAGTWHLAPDRGTSRACLEMIGQHLCLPGHSDGEGGAGLGSRRLYCLHSQPPTWTAGLGSGWGRASAAPRPPVSGNLQPSHQWMAISMRFWSDLGNQSRPANFQGAFASSDRCTLYWLACVPGRNVPASQINCRQTEILMTGKGDKPTVHVRIASMPSPVSCASSLAT